MKRKGISPLIAAVMLLAFAMAVGGIFSEWSGELFRSTTSQTADDQGEILDCSSRSIAMTSVEYGSNNNWVNATFRAEDGSLGEVRVGVQPSGQTDVITLGGAGEVNTTGIYISSGNQQDSIRAASRLCRVSLEQELEY